MRGFTIFPGRRILLSYTPVSYALIHLGLYIMMEDLHPGTDLSLTDLPIDILRIIFEFLTPARNLANTMLVCCLFRDMIEPLLYRAISLQLRLPSNTGNGLDADGSLLRTLSSRPQLGHHVIVLSLTELYDTESVDFSRQPKLLSLLPHLRELSLNPPSPRLNLTGHLFLRYLRLDLGEDRIYPDSEQPVEIIAQNSWTPTLSTLQIEWLTLEGNWSHYFPSKTYRTSSILDLRIHLFFQEDRSVNILPDILSSIKSLKKFTLDSEDQGFISHAMRDGLSLDELCLALFPHADTLEDMVIAASDGCFLCRTFPRCVLMDFSALRRLGIPENFLEYRGGSRAELLLPPKLEELQLQHQLFFNRSEDWSPHYERLSVIAEMKRKSLLALKLVVWWTQMSEVLWGLWGNPRFTTQFEPFVSTFQEVGVLFYSVDQSYFKDTPFGTNSKDPTMALL